jgi:AcrR family transcriptional regulator
MHADDSAAAGKLGGHSCLPRKRGRKRDDTLDGHILDAAIEVLARDGYEHMTMDAVATAARAGKGAIYRRWPSKAQLVVDAIAHTSAVEVPLPPDTGSLRGDLHALLDGRPKPKDARLMRVMAGLVAVLPLHPDLAAIAREQLAEPRRLVQRSLFERAVARGEIPPGRDLDSLSYVMPALVFHRQMVLGEPVDQAFLSHLIDQVLLPLATAPVPAYPVLTDPVPTNPVQTDPAPTHPVPLDQSPADSRR